MNFTNLIEIAVFESEIFEIQGTPWDDSIQHVGNLNSRNFIHWSKQRTWVSTRTQQFPNLIERGRHFGKWVLLSSGIIRMQEILSTDFLITRVIDFPSVNYNRVEEIYDNAFSHLLRRKISRAKRPHKNSVHLNTEFPSRDQASCFQARSFRFDERLKLKNIIIQSN